jgi:hypothetical protein
MVLASLSVFFEELWIHNQLQLKSNRGKEEKNEKLTFPGTFQITLLHNFLNILIVIFIYIIQILY